MILFWLILFVVKVALVWWVIVSVIDYRRQSERPTRTQMTTAATGPAFSTEERVASLPLRRAPVFAGRELEKVSPLGAIADKMQSGDLLLFSGRQAHSWLIRVATYSAFSHAGMVIRDDEGLWVVDVCEGSGGQRRALAQDVIDWPGRWYWAHVDRKHFANFVSEGAAHFSKCIVGCKYGYFGVGIQIILNLPILRELAYVFHIHSLPWFNLLDPFCSVGVTLMARDGGGVDPSNGRLPQLVTPQDLCQSLLWTRNKVALV